jgi:hypothetical protein
MTAQERIRKALAYLDTAQKSAAMSPDFMMVQDVQKSYADLVSILLETAKQPAIRHVDYWQKSDSQLRYIIKDAGEAARAMRGFGLLGDGEAKYLDQVNDACTVLSWRKSQGYTVRG